MSGRKEIQVQRGFSLVELAVVLVIIGLIMGAVTLASGVQRSAEYSSIHSRFVLGWHDAYVEYFNVSGFVIGDGLPASGQVDGGDAVTVGPICGRDSATLADEDTDLRAIFVAAGVEFPSGRGINVEDIYAYNDSEGDLQQLQVCFDYVTNWDTTSGEQAANLMVVSGATVDLAKKIDALIDVNSDAGWGEVRWFDEYSNGGSVAWPTLLDGGDMRIISIVYRMPF